MNVESNLALSRRSFLATAGGLAMGSVASTSLIAAEPKATTRFPLIGFSKPFRQLSYKDAAALVERVGWDGIECPVRDFSTHIKPEQVEEELPKFVDALDEHGKKIYIVSTSIRDASDPGTVRLLRTLKELNISRYRLAFWKYDLDRPLEPQLNNIQSQLRDIVALNQELGLKAGLQNHSGRQFVGAPVWDIHELVRDMDSRYIGGCFDIGHATLEGGYAWPLHARRMANHLTAVFVKDFYWVVNNHQWKAKWCPLGEGMVRKEFFKWLKNSSYEGPISQHHEYNLGSGNAPIRYFRRDLKKLRSWLEDG